MIEQLIKENIEAMRELTAAIRKATAVHDAVDVLKTVGVPVADLESLVAEGNTKAEPAAPAVWTQDTARDAFLKVCKTPEGKAKAAEALKARGKSRLSELADSQLADFMAAIL